MDCADGVSGDAVASPWRGKTANDARRLIFVSMTNLLLISSLVSLMSMSLEGVCHYHPVAITEICS